MPELDHDHTVTTSVLVTVHNREDYLAETLSSILDSANSDYEVMVVDDASTDASLEIANAFSGEHSSVHVHRNPENLGDYPNRLRAASLARGRYLKYVDSDDLIYSHSLALMVDALDRNPDAALALCHSAPEDERPYPWRLSPEEAYRKQFLGRGCLNCGPSGAIIRRDAFEAVGGFRPEWGLLADIDLWYRLAARWPVVLLPPGLVWWRRHSGQEYCHGGAALSYLRQELGLAQVALTDASCPLSDADTSRALERARQHFARRLWSLALRQRQPVTAWQLYKDSGIGLRELAKGLRSYA